MPRTLLDALWLQFAHSVLGNRIPRQCKCGRYFETSPGTRGRSANKIFCKPACKLKDYRRRMDLALRLKAEGKKLEDIAKETGTELKTVRNWLKHRKG
jgi:hypothetical protein